MVNTPPTLAEVQARFQEAVLGRGSVLDLVPGNSCTDNKTLFGVYSYAYMARLVDVVRAEHPYVAALLGDEGFRHAAEGYVKAHPSRTSNARWFPEQFPEFLATSDYPAAVGELAYVERALNRAFDAADVPVLELSALAAIPPDTWGDVVFDPHPSAEVLAQTTNAFAIWQALKNDAAPPEMLILSEQQTLLAWRRGTTASIRALDIEENMMWREAATGVSFGALCALLAVFADAETAPLRAAKYLQGWISSGMLSAARLVKKQR